MVDRVLVYPQELPRSADFLTAEKNMLYGLGYLAQTAVGTNTCVTGLVGAQTTVASMQITIGQGAIYAVETVDATAYAGLGTDANTIVKQGLLKAAQTLTLTAPGTSGYSQVYLVEAAYQDVDGGSTVLPYYNASNPTAPYSGPANAGTSQYTIRQGVCTITLKAGTAAPTGSQTTPSTDAGYVPLYTITVANGQTQIFTANIITATSAPFVTMNLNYIPGRLLRTTIFTNISGTQYVQVDGGAATTTGATTFTPLAAATTTEIELSGGGGGSAGASATTSGQNSAGGGGSSGASAWKRIVGAIGSAQTVTVGAGGSGGVGAATGGNGGATSVGALVAANGGLGGSPAGPASSSSNFYATPGSAPAAGSSGTINQPGRLGNGGLVLASQGVNEGGIAGNVLGGYYGSGGGPVFNPVSAGALTGQAGVSGIVIIREFA